MNIIELTKKVRESAATRTKEQQIELLRKANIIDENGYYSTRFFSEHTVANDIAKGNPIKV
jgi:hypothetical protein